MRRREITRRRPRPWTLTFAAVGHWRLPLQLKGLREEQRISLVNAVALDRIAITANFGGVALEPGVREVGLGEGIVEISNEEIIFEPWWEEHGFATVNDGSNATLLKTSRSRVNEPAGSKKSSACTSSVDFGGHCSELLPLGDVGNCWMKSQLARWRQQQIAQSNRIIFHPSKHEVETYALRYCDGDTDCALEGDPNRIDEGEICRMRPSFRCPGGDRLVMTRILRRTNAMCHGQRHVNGRICFSIHIVPNTCVWVGNVGASEPLLYNHSMRAITRNIVLKHCLFFAADEFATLYNAAETSHAWGDRYERYCVLKGRNDNDECHFCQLIASAHPRGASCLPRPGESFSYD